MKPAHFLTVALLAIAVAGCTNPYEDQVIGTWKGRLHLSDEDAARAPQTDFSTAAEYKKAAESKVVELVVREDGSFTVRGFGDPFTDAWIVQGSELILASSGSNPSTVAGSSAGIANRIPMSLQISEDGSTLTFTDPKKEMTSQIIFKKE